MTPFPSGTVGHSLTLMRGVWHDHIEIYDLAGNPLAEDVHSGAPGAAPFDNLVYIDFDGVNYRQTNVTFNGRPLHVRSFAGTLVDGVLEFLKLGPEDPGHIGISAGPGILFYLARTVTDAWQRYSEPDCIYVTPHGQRTRTTVLYRNGVAVRTLTASGYKLAPIADRRLPWDPRGEQGGVHALLQDTFVFKENIP